MKLARNPWHDFTPMYQLHLDEAGRGPLAWPVSVGCTLVHQQIDTTAFRDSKQLTKKKRQSCYESIVFLCEQWDLSVWVWYGSNHMIDTVWIIKTLRHASLQAVGQCLFHAYLTHRRNQLLASPYGENIMAVVELDNAFSKKSYTIKSIATILSTEQTVFSISSLLIDGNHTFGLDRLPVNVVTIIKWDSKNPKISMASIVAKVERDRWMCHIANTFPKYHFDDHKWYGTQKHRACIVQYWLTKYHRTSYCTTLLRKWAKPTSTSSHRGLIPQWWSKIAPLFELKKTLEVLQSHLPNCGKEKPWLLLHICCGPDLTWPLHRLKNHFKLYLFWYNPNIHPRKEHTKRYDQFLKLVWLEKGDYEIIEDRYDPKEFFKAMIDQKETISADLKDADNRTVLQVAWDMEERSDRCNPCYSMRLDQAAKQAVQSDIPYFTSTLLISPKKHWWKLFDRWVEAQHRHGSHFLWFDFAKNEGYTKAVELTRKHNLRRQQYCGCWWTVPKPGEKRKVYQGG